MAISRIIITFLTIFAASYAAASSDRSTRRALLAEKTVQGCLWDNMECAANPQYALSLTAPDDKAKLAQKIAAMDYKCGTYTTNTTCEGDVVDQCYWYPTSETEGSCRWQSGNWYPILACPNSKAYQIVACTQASSEASCLTIPGCKYHVPTAEEIAAIMAKMLAEVVAAVSKATQAELTSDKGPEGMCFPTGMTLESYYTDVMAHQEQANFDDTAAWGTCEGVKVLKYLETACLNKTQAECNETSVCTSVMGGIAGDEFMDCRFMIEDQMKYIFTNAASGDFDTKMEALVDACAAATNETDCTAVGAAHPAKFEEAVVTTALECFKSSAGATAAAAHVMLAAVVAVVLFMA